MKDSERYVGRPRRAPVLTTLSLLAVIGCGGGKEGLPPPDAGAARDPERVMVTAAPVEVRPVQRTVEVVGTLRGFEEVALSAQVEGPVRKVRHDVAARVGPGELLLEIDPTDYELAVRQAEKGLQVELAKLGLESLPTSGFDVAKVPFVAQSQAMLDAARLRLARVQAARGAASAEELDDRRAELRTAEAEYENQISLARSGLATAQLKQEALAIAQQELQDALVRVPTPTRAPPGRTGDVTYTITQRLVSEGTLVRPGTELFKVVIDDPLKLRTPVPERHVGEIEVGQKVEVYTSAYPAPFTGTVNRINPAVDPETRTFEVETLVPNPDRKLKPGGFAKAVIVTRLDPNAVTVPLEAPVRFAGVTKLFLVEGGRAKEVQVVLGVQGTEWAEVTAPRLPGGAAVVTSGQSALADGTPVEVRDGAGAGGR